MDNSLETKITAPHGPDPPPFPREQRRPSDRPGAVQGAKRRSRTLDGEDRSGIIQGEGKGGGCRRD